MKILRIAGRNLASLAGEFCVDFTSEPLASSGLFAICGPTGAGKSTLLDALCLALYGNTPRLQGRGSRSALPDAGGEAVSTGDARNLLRRGAAEGHAEVDFVGNDNLHYRARWSVRRSRNKASGLLQAANMSVHRLPELLALGGTKTEAQAEIAARIGLSFEQFTRSVLLAQNEFSAFLKTDENERGELLETLTGSAIYSDISRRAYERYKLEQEALRRLNGRLADQAPLAPQARASLDAASLEADAALAAIEVRRALLETQLRWHEESARLAQGQVQAQHLLDEANAHSAQAQARRARLATLDAVQGARPLMTELTRLETERTELEAQLVRSGQALAHADEAARVALDAAQAAANTLAGAESAQAAAGSALDAAKALDATLATLDAAHARSASEQAASQAQAARSSALLADANGALAASQHAEAATQAWLGAQQQHADLAAQWPRWERLLTQAAQAASAQDSEQAALARAAQAHGAAAATLAAAQQAASAAAARLASCAAARAAAATAAASIDPAALHAARQALETRRDALAAAASIDQALQAACTRQARLDATIHNETGVRDAAAAATQATLAAWPALDAAATQAEQALKGAELACADTVQDLRATLTPEQPCPVCGSASHPYAMQDARLHAVFATLQEDLTRRRAALQENLSQQASARAAAQGAGTRLTALLQERAALEDDIAQQEAAWQANAPALPALEASARPAWFACALDELRAALLANDSLQQQARSAAQAQAAAQTAFEAATDAHLALQEAARQGASRLEQLTQAQATLASEAARSSAQLAALLDELDPPLRAAAGERWQQAWRADPAPWQGARAAEAREWNGQLARLQGLRETLAQHLAAQREAALRAEHAAVAAASARQACEHSAGVLAEQRLARAGLFDGQSVVQVEQALRSAVGDARAALIAHQASASDTAQRATEVRTALAQGRERSSALQDAARDAAARLADWLEAYASAGGERDPIDNPAQLASLLGVGAAWLAQERAALLALDAAQAQAATVLAERRRQHQLHLASAGPDAQLADAGAVAAQLESVLAEQGAARQQATQWRLQAAQDDERRARAQAMLGEIERQGQVEARWGRLADLIGSADGKKFRNYAQQFTLDVLLGYANSHLQQLARRYRLERVDNAGAPSLALLVRDQDMGGEIRSVNSLSGGESFLVSLALALGLASLSSNRVRVESLFIDEGFGSLDSETLGVAMDALDALQSLGRKVGVISHVQEMTERIATRIQVRPAGGGSSVVSVGA